MPRGKARYNAPPTLVELIESGAPLPDFSDELNRRLREFYPDNNITAESVFGDPVNAFVQHLLAEARQAIDELAEAKRVLTKQDARAELDDLWKTLSAAEYKLRKLSLTVDFLLGADAAPRDWADLVATWIPHVKSARERLKGRSRKQRRDEANHAIAVEMAISVLRAAKDYGIKSSATADPEFDYISDAVQILKAIGDDIGLRFTARHP